MKIKKIFATILVGIQLIGIVFAENINTQVFTVGEIPQTTISSPMTNQCTNNDNFAFYNGQRTKFTSSLRGTNINDTWRIMNTTVGGNGQIYPNGAIDSSKIFVYNPLGRISSSNEYLEPNSFIPNFAFVSNIKPSGIDKVFVGFQSSFSYMLGGTDILSEEELKSGRKEIAGQIIHNNWVRKPKTISNNNGTEYTYTKPINKEPGFEQGNITLKLSFSDESGYRRTDHNKYSCSNIYIASCGDGIIDNPDKDGGNNTDGKQGILSSKGFAAWVKTGFVGEVCDSNTETGEPCVNGTPGCCNKTCSGFGGDGGFCGDGIVQEELDEQCDLGPWDENTEQGNNDSVQLSECATFCELNLEPETFPEELG